MADKNWWNILYNLTIFLVQKHFSLKIFFLITLLLIGIGGS